jgi:hypothetical protein
VPLVKSATPKAFKANVRREVSAGRPVKQAVAIAFSVKRRSRAKSAHEHVQRKHHALNGY